MDTQDKEKAIKNIIKEENLILDVKETLNALEQIAREDLSIKELEESEFSAKAQIATLYKKYQHLKAESSMFDFDDLILEVRKVLKENKVLSEK
jgi:superfamily I DNA/RNA helicase